MEASSREARRRRILERGSDRLAFITGRIQTMPSSSSSAESHDSALSLIADDHQLSAQPSDSLVSDDKSTSSLFHQHGSNGDSGDINGNNGERKQPVLNQCKTSAEALRSPSELNNRVDSQVLSEVLGSSVSPPAAEYLHGCHRKLLTPNQMGSAIAASEFTRIYFSIGVAILVVLSSIGFPILRSDITKSIIISKPLYLVLLTNVSIVFARFLLDKQRESERHARGANTILSMGGDGLAEKVGKTLEWALVLQNLMVATFMDCSIYVLVVICGLSVARKLGW
ncbi:hypothetical protein NMG60_11000859 [Bertholletia excelsa]